MVFIIPLHTHSIYDIVATICSQWHPSILSDQADRQRRKDKAKERFVLVDVEHFIDEFAVKLYHEGNIDLSLKLGSAQDATCMSGGQALTKVVSGISACVSGLWLTGKRPMTVDQCGWNHATQLESSSLLPAAMYILYYSGKQQG